MQLNDTTGVPQAWPGDTNTPGMAARWGAGAGRAHSTAGMTVRVSRAGEDLQPPPSKSTPGKLWTLKSPAGIEVTPTASPAAPGMFAGDVSAEFGIWGLVMWLMSPEAP